MFLIEASDSVLNVPSAKVLTAQSLSASKVARPWTWTREDDELLKSETSVNYGDEKRSAGFSGHMLETFANQRGRPFFLKESVNVNVAFQDIQVLEVNEATVEPVIREITVVLKTLPRYEQGDPLTVVAEVLPMCTKDNPGMAEYKARLLYTYWPAFKDYVRRRGAPDQFELTIASQAFLNISEKEVLISLGCELLEDFVNLPDDLLKSSPKLVSKKEIAKKFLSGFNAVKSEEVTGKRTRKPKEIIEEIND